MRKIVIPRFGGPEVLELVMGVAHLPEMLAAEGSQKAPEQTEHHRALAVNLREHHRFPVLVLGIEVRCGNAHLQLSFRVLISRAGRA